MDAEAAVAPILHAGWPAPGQAFGHYRIARLLGEGGMGAVFEAQDMDSGRRVALKVLGHRIDSPDARNRFFREGRLAASVNHPNSVYVFGTEEIAGIPVIAMELVAGGTLQERVSREGPMPVGDVVDSALQIIAGLEAAQRVGVLHRDIKPSNCFVEADGTLKVGDFGLSISTFVRTEPALTATGAFLGTPAFSSPEQLRGDELTVRSDIYSTGVTLYYLLTGRHPFEAPDLVRLLATVLERRPDSPAKWCPGLPGELCRVVLRCLEKDPEKRFRSYDELRNALLPYASAAPTPATLGLRILAYCLDALLLVLPSSLVNMLVRGSGELSPVTSEQVVAMNLSRTALVVLYFGLLEGLWGASVGKQICRLRVTRPDRTAAGVPRAMLRALVLAAIPNAVWLLGYAIVPAPGADPFLGGGLTIVSLLSVAARALLFATARRRNGFAGLHDLASGTRVVIRSVYQARPSLALAPEALPQTKSLPLIGPYHVLNRLGSEDGSELLLGFDARLLRRVWIRKLPPGRTPLPSALRQLGRPGRLRWLTAQRTGTEAWDAYEATPGQPLLTIITEPQEWGRVRFWLLDLAEELDAGSEDGSLPAILALNRVWITADGRAKLLDFPAPGTLEPGPGRWPAGGDAAPTPQAFLRQVGISALQGTGADLPGGGETRPGVPVALHASRFLEALKPDAKLKECILQLRSLLSLPAQVSRVRRTALAAGALALPVVAMLLGAQVRVFTDGVNRVQLRAVELAALRWHLAQHEALSRQAPPSDSEAGAELEALETYIAARFAPLITNASRWNSDATRSFFTEPLRARAERILAERPPPSNGQFMEASARVRQLVKNLPQTARAGVNPISELGAALMMGYATAVMLVIFPCLIGSLLFRGGALVKLLGIAFVDRTGARASRWRVAARNLVAWLPFLLLPATLNTDGLSLALLGLCAGLVLISVLLRQRGIADRLVGTWPVPR